MFKKIVIVFFVAFIFISTSTSAFAEDELPKMKHEIIDAIVIPKHFTE